MVDPEMMEERGKGRSGGKMVSKVEHEAKGWERCTWARWRSLRQSLHRRIGWT